MPAGGSAGHGVQVYQHARASEMALIARRRAEIAVRRIERDASEQESADAVGGGARRNTRAGHSADRPMGGHKGAHRGADRGGTRATPRRCHSNSPRRELLSRDVDPRVASEPRPPPLARSLPWRQLRPVRRRLERRRRQEGRARGAAGGPRPRARRCAAMVDQRARVRRRGRRRSSARGVRSRRHRENPARHGAAPVDARCSGGARGCPPRGLAGSVAALGGCPSDAGARPREAGDRRGRRRGRAGTGTPAARTTPTRLVECWDDRRPAALVPWPAERARARHHRPRGPAPHRPDDPVHPASGRGAGAGPVRVGRDRPAGGRPA